METKIKRLSKKFIGVLLGVVLLSAGCGGGGGGGQQQRVTLTFWDPFMDSQDIQPIIDAYNQKNSAVTIVYSKKDINTYGEDLLNALAAGNGPDIFSINNSWLPTFLDKATPSPASIFTLKDFKAAYVDAVVNDFTKDGQIYGSAMSVDSLALYYNKDLMGSAGIATPPKTWSELAGHVQRLKRQDNRGYFTRSGVAMGTNGNVNRAVDVLYLLMLQQGAVPFTADGYPNFNQSIQKNGNYFNPGLAALSFYTSFASPASPNYNWNSQSDYSIDAFANNRAAYLLSYSYTRQTILQKSPNLNFDVAAAPQASLDGLSVNFANYWGHVVSKQSRNWLQAWDFVKFLTSKESLDKYYAQVKVPSSRRDLVELQAADPEIGVFASANLTAKTFYKPDQAKIDGIFGRAIDNVILRGYTADEALDEASQQAAAVASSVQK